jgi:lipoate-protein ligase A
LPPHIGGGTVYQDLGNLSFCFITRFTDKKINNYVWFNRPVIAALKAIGVEAEMDARNSILCKGKKISGNAQFTNRKNIISHGTLLFNADLDNLRACLKPNPFKVESKAVESVSNSVRNIDAETTAVKTTEELKTYLQNALQATEVMQLSDHDWEVIQKSADEKFRSFEWIHGRSPLTKIDKGDIQLEIEDGKIRTITGNQTETLQLEGTRYQYNDIKKALENHPNASAMLQAIF